nr:methyltransferase domain-containing protein [Propionibacteriales bacterium]
ARVWSCLPGRDAVKRAGGWDIAWPILLKPFLDGTADVVIRDLQADAAVFTGEVSFGSGSGQVRVSSPDGLPLAIDKGGFLTPMFGDRDQQRIETLLDGCQHALAILAELEVPAFLAFGCLLGAVRDGRLIGHDNDADLVYLASASHPVDVILESLRFERAFRERGWSTRRMSGGDFKLLLDPPEAQGEIDVFAGFYRGKTLYSIPSFGAAVSPKSLLPLSTVVLEGRELTAPADSGRLLTASYGPRWRTPDPTFKFAPSRRTKRVLVGFLRGERRHQRYWDDFYKLHADGVPRNPSAYAEHLVEHADGPMSVVDIGAGTGRDALYFARQGWRVLGCDYSRAGVKYAESWAADQGLAAEFRALNLYDMRDVLVSGASLARQGLDAVYARFLVHALEAEGRQNLWLVSRSVLRPLAGRLYLEFRTETTQHEYGEHFRQFVQPAVVIAELEHHGFEIEHCENGHGLAVHKDEDPRVCRITASVRKAQ